MHTSVPDRGDPVQGLPGGLPVQGLPGHGGRAMQKARTRKAIVDACRELTRSGAEVTMPRVAARAMVSEATAYRYFPDLVSLLEQALVGLWPDPAQALAPVTGSADPVERVAFATEFLLRGVHAYQGAVRAMISHTIAAPASSLARPGIRFGLVDFALAPFEDPPTPAVLSAPPTPPRLSADAMTTLKRDLALVVSAEAFFTLTDLCGLSADEAIASAVRTAATLTRAAFAPGRAGLREPDRPALGTSTPMLVRWEKDGPTRSAPMGAR
jgi:AcrR family transcriptional regulator